jgi:hypothetical protein
MYSVELIEKALVRVSLPEKPHDGVCCVTGKKGPTLPRGLAIKPSFTRFDLLRAPESTRVGIPAWRTLNYSPTRKSSWWCDGQCFRKMTKEDVFSLLFECKESSAPWAGYVTTSYKKHGALLAPVNQRESAVWLFETTLVDCSDTDKVQEYWNRLGCMYNAGLTKTELKTLVVSLDKLSRIGLSEWIRFEQWAKNARLSVLYDFLLFILKK